MMNRNQKIAASFDKAAEFYELHGTLQKKAAFELYGLLPKWLKGLPPGPVLELGCGTGLVSQQLVRELKGFPICLSDLSQAMLLAAQEKIEAQPQVTFEKRDANEPLPSQHYSLILSALALQWLREPAQGVVNFSEALKPGGKLILSFMTDASFSEWKAAALDLGLPFSGNALPAPDQVRSALEACPGTLDWKLVNFKVKFPKTLAFFCNLKAIGAGVRLEESHLNPGQMKRLIQYLDEKNQGGLTMTSQVAFACYQRPA